MCRCITVEFRLVPEHATNWDTERPICCRHVADERLERDGELRERNVEFANGCAVAECIGQWESDGGFCGNARFVRRCAPV